MYSIFLYLYVNDLVFVRSNKSLTVINYKLINIVHEFSKETKKLS